MPGAIGPRWPRSCAITRHASASSNGWLAAASGARVNQRVAPTGGEVAVGHQGAARARSRAEPCLSACGALREFRLDAARGGSVPRRLRIHSARGGRRTPGNSRSRRRQAKAAVRAVNAISALQIAANVQST